MVARELKSIVLGGKSFALELFNPTSVMVRKLESTYLFFTYFRRVNHCISPSQYDFTVVSGVPPPITTAKSFIDFVTHSPTKLRKSQIWNIAHYISLIIGNP